MLDMPAAIPHSVSFDGKVAVSSCKLVRCFFFWVYSSFLFGEWSGGGALSVPVNRKHIHHIPKSAFSSFRFLFRVKFTKKQYKMFIRMKNFTELGMVEW